MIYGIGTDILQLSRVADTYERFGARFVERLLMPEERTLFDGARNAVRFLAMRFAAKEAVVKAMGTGFSCGMGLRDTGVLADARGRPEVIFSVHGRQVCEDLGIGAGHLTLSDEAGLVVAVAVLMRRESTVTA